MSPKTFYFLFCLSFFTRDCQTTSLREIIKGFPTHAGMLAYNLVGPCFTLQEMPVMYTYNFVGEYSDCFRCFAKLALDPERLTNNFVWMTILLCLTISRFFYFFSINAFTVNNNELIVLLTTSNWVAFGISVEVIERELPQTVVGSKDDSKYQIYIVSIR